MEPEHAGDATGIVRRMSTSRNDLVALVQQPTHFLDATDHVLRRMAVTALSRSEAIAEFGVLSDLATDAHSDVRAAVAEKLGVVGTRALPVLASLQIDREPTVREAVATAYGDIGDASAVDWLLAASGSDDDRAVREAAVASLGAIGDPSAVDHLLTLLKDGPPPVRRRTVAALTVFDDDRIEPAIQRAALDRNPGVREAAEMVVGRQIEPLDR